MAEAEFLSPGKPFNLQSLQFAAGCFILKWYPAAVASHAEMPQVTEVSEELEPVGRRVRAVARGAGQFLPRMPGIRLAADRMRLAVKKGDYMVSGLPHVAGQT